MLPAPSGPAVNDGGLTAAAFARAMRSDQPAFFLDPGIEGSGRWGECGTDPSVWFSISGRRASLREGADSRTESWEDAWSGMGRWIESRRARGETVAGFLGFEFGNPGAGATSKPDAALAAYPVVRDVDAEPETSRANRPSIPLLEPLSDPELFRTGVRRTKELIASGALYQLNLSHPFRIRGISDSAAFYADLRRRNPVAYGARLIFPGFEILSASPECLVSVRGRTVETRPIKGTRPRGRTPEEDAVLARELVDSAKDNAELTMIVDLARNDLGRVCEPGSVAVVSRATLLTIPTVHHLEGTVRGTLRDGVRLGELLRAVFPGGSVTGCPKPAALQWIRELEGADRGPYCGAIGIFRPDGSIELSVAIRTAVWDSATGDLSLRSGAGITALSDPDAEYDEVLEKASAFARTVRSDISAR